MDLQKLDKYTCNGNLDAPLVSIIIATYNSELDIAKCLQSVTNQSYKNIEIIIMDGGSSDKTLDIAKSFKDDRIKIVSEKDRGIYDARNKAVDLSIGDWVAFIGSDDVYYHTDAIASLMKGLWYLMAPLWFMGGQRTKVPIGTYLDFQAVNGTT